MRFETDEAVERAMDLFWLQGYAATTPAQLAQEMGIGKGSLYNTFESKHALFVRALRRYGELRVDRLTELLTPAGPVRPRLKAAVAELAGLGVHQRGCVMVNAAAELGPADDEVNEIADGLFARIEEIFAAAITQGHQSGELDRTRPASTSARQLLASVIGLSVLVRSGGRAEMFADAVDGIVDGL